MVRKVNTKLLSDVRNSGTFLQYPTFFPLVDFIDIWYNGVISRGFWGEVRVNGENSRRLFFILSFLDKNNTFELLLWEVFN
jgi:hypothetical protein